MSKAKGDQGQAVEHPRDAKAIVAGGEAEVPPVPVRGEPDIEHLGCCRHDRGLAARPPNVHGRRDENERHSQHQQPKQEIGEQHAGGVAATRFQSSPRPDASGMKAQRYISVVRTSTPLGTGCHIGAKLPLIRPRAPKAIMVAAKAAWPAFAMRMAFPPLVFQFIDALSAYLNRGLTRKRQAAARG